jgi:transposase
MSCAMTRHILSENVWGNLEGALRRSGAYLTKTTKITVEAILWRTRTGAPWRDLPEEFGPWQTAYNRFNRWAKAGRIGRIFEILKVGVDGEWQCLDASIIKVHQHAAGARSQDDEAIGKSRGGATTKLHALCDANGNPTKLLLTPGQTSDVKAAPSLLAAVEEGAEAIIGDRAYDATFLRKMINDLGMTPVIPFRSCTQEGRRVGYDRFLYRQRHLIENLFCRLKHFRAVATRYDKTARNYLATVVLASTFLWAQLV